jgi:hypothetical protein
MTVAPNMPIAIGRAAGSSGDHHAAGHRVPVGLDEPDLEHVRDADDGNEGNTADSTQR